MEAAGLALGVVGAAGLFQTCLVMYDSVNVYRHFEQDARRLRTRFDANKIAFRQWGFMVKLGEEDESPKLRDPEVRKHVQRVLIQINETLENNQRSRKIAESSSNPESLSPDLSFRRVDSVSSGETTKFAWRERAKWVMRGKEAFEKQLEMLEGFIAVLYRIIPDQESTTEHLDTLDKDISQLTASLTGQSAEIQKLMEIVEQKKLELDELIASDAREKVLKWLNPLPSEERYIAALRDRVEGTCEWLFEREEFQDWRSEHPRVTGLKLLWVHGPAGFGKTFTSARAVEHLKALFPNAVAHFFCTSENEAMRKAMSVVRTWLGQMIRQNESLLREAYAQFRVKEQQYATEKELWHLFKITCEIVPHAIFIVDGVDELVQADPVERLEIESSRASFLEQLVTNASFRNCNILITSRRTADIETALKKADGRFWFEEIAITVTDVQSDVNKFSKQSVQGQLSTTSDDLQAELTKEMATKCDGMFLLVRLWTSRLSPGKSTKKLRAAVSEMPKGLERAFERDLAMINDLEDDDDRTRAVDIIRWTMCANRALTVGELTDALIVCSDHGDSEAFPDDDLPSSMGEEYVQRQLLHLCGSLLEVRKSLPGQAVKDQTVHFVHFTAREFLSKRIMQNSLSEQPRELVSGAQLILAESCLRFLCYDNFDQDVRTAADINALCDKRPFLRYASNEWHSHASKSHEQYGKLLPKTQRFLTEKKSNWKLWAWNFEYGRASDQQQGTQQDDNGIANLLYYVTRINYPVIMRALLESGMDPNELGGSQGCAIQAAANNANREAIELLIEFKADINGQSKERPGTLGWAIPTASEEFIAWLLLLGVDVSFRSETGASPLHYAITNGRQDIVKLLLLHHAPLNARSDNGATPLHIASSRGFAEIATILLENGADPLAQTKDGVTPLHDACLQGRRKLVEILLLQPNGMTALNIYNNNFSPLHTACYSGNDIPIIKQLLDAGAEVEAAKVGNFTPLFFAARQSKLSVVKFLLEQCGAKVQPRSDETWSVLHAAIESKNEAVIEAILSHDPPINFRYHDGLTAISMAASKGLANTVQVLIQKGAIVNGNEGGKDPLPYAGESGDLATVEILLAHGADIEHSQYAGLNVLEGAAKNNHDAVVRRLLQKGAKLRIRDVNSTSLLHVLAFSGPDAMLRLILEELGTDLIDRKDSSGRTALFYAAEKGHDERVAILINFGADVNVVKNTSASPLHEACRGGHHSVVKRLIAAGANVNSRMVDDLGTPFYVAVQCGYKDLVELLYAHSADVDLGLKDNWTPLLKAAFDGREEIVQFLLGVGAELYAQNNLGNSALHYAVGFGSESLARMLLEFEASSKPTEDLSGTPTSQGTIIFPSQNSANLPLTSTVRDQHEKRLIDLQNARSSTALHVACQEGKAPLVKLLMSYGADPAKVDGLGHSCSDWAVSQGDVFHAIGAQEYVPTSADVRKSKLRQTLAQIRDHLSESSSSYYLGQCLMYLDDLDAATIAFEQKVWYDDNGDLHHYAICNGCRLTDRAVGNMTCSVRWVCFDCFDLDLCRSCFEREKQEGWLRFPQCKDHRYLKVPRDVFKELKPGTVDEAGTSFSEWVNQVLDRYGVLGIVKEE